MRKLIALLLTAVLLLSALVSCTAGGDTPETTAGDTNETTAGAADETTGDVTADTTADGETTGTGDADPDASGRMNFIGMDLTPYVTLAQYKNVPCKASEIEFEISMRVLLYNSGSHYSEIKSGDRTVKEGDLINVNYKGILDGEAFSGGTAENQIITVYEGTGYIEGFASGFIGAKAGESSSFDVTFPSNYGEASLAGKQVTFEFTVNAIYDFDEITDEIASELSEGAYPTVAEFEAYRRSLLFVTDLWSSIVQSSTVLKYPEQQVEYYYRQIISTYRLYAEAYGMTLAELLEYYKLTEDALYASAKEYVLEDLVYYGIINAEGITLTDEEYNAKIDAYITRYKEEFKYTDAEIEEHLDEIRENMLYDKFQRLLAEWADVTWE